MVDRRAFLAAAASLPLAAPVLAQKAAGAGVRPASGNMLRPDKASDPHARAVGALADHAVRVRWTDLDAATVVRAKQRLLDVIGCAFAGAVSENQAVLAAATGMAAPAAGRGGASLIGFGRRVPAAEAAMVNAVSARAWDFEVMTIVADDIQMESHHAPTTVMTALALAEDRHLSGRDMLTAMIVGDDISARILASTGVDFGKGWSPPPLFSTWGGTAIAARMLGLNAQGLRDAWGIAVDQICGTGQAIWDGATNWKLAQGVVSRNAVFSAMLARGGWSGMNDPLGAPFGFFAQFTGGCTRPEILNRDLGRLFYAEEYFKPYPQCAATHPSLEASLELQRSHALDARDIAAITVRVQPRTMGLFMSKAFQMTPSPHAQANFSLSFAVASALLHGGFTLENYRPAAMADARLQRLIAATRIAPIATGQPGVRIELMMRDGRTFALDRTAEASHYPRMGGSSQAEIEAKFRAQLRFAGFVPDAAADAIVARVGRIEQERDIADFMALLARHVAPGQRRPDDRV